MITMHDIEAIEEILIKADDVQLQKIRQMVDHERVKRMDYR